MKSVGSRYWIKVCHFLGLLILAPVYGIISLAIYADDPGPVFFTQKRVGKDKHYFELHKFRSMKKSAPHRYANPPVKRSGEVHYKSRKDPAKDIPG